MQRTKSHRSVWTSFRRRLGRALPVLAVMFVLAGCATEAQKQANEIREGRSATNLTTGLVQREITVGMPSAEVIEKLGSPNILSTDAEGREVWVYERFARDMTSSDAGFFVIFFGTGNKSASVSERSLTVIIKFDHEDRVRDFAYHATSF